MDAAVDMAVVVACGGLGGAASQGRTALRATSNLVQVSRRGKAKHRGSPAAKERISDDGEMDYAVWVRPLMDLRSTCGEERTS